MELNFQTYVYFSYYAKQLFTSEWQHLDVFIELQYVSYCLLTADWIRVVSGLSPAMTLYG